MDVQFAYTISLNNDKTHTEIFNNHIKNMQNGKKLWYLTIYDVISAQKYDL